LNSSVRIDVPADGAFGCPRRLFRNGVDERQRTCDMRFIAFLSTMMFTASAESLCAAKALH
jgi:hypothetical protein